MNSFRKTIKTQKDVVFSFIYSYAYYLVGQTTFILLKITLVQKKANTESMKERY